MINPYSVLGLQPDASDEEITKAFKKKSFAVHPDHGGTAETWAQVRLAYDILRDPKKRMQYDQEGTVADVGPDNIEANAKENVARFFLQSVEAVLNNPSINQTDLDLVQGGKTFFNNQIRQHRSNISMIEKKINQIDRILKRLKCKAKEDVVSKMLRNHMGILKQNVHFNRDQIKVFEQALIILEDYSFEDETPTLISRISPYWPHQ